MGNKIISTEDALPWCQICDGHLETYLFAFNDSKLIPKHWHEEEDLLELQIHFDLEDLIQEMVDNRRVNGEDPSKECFQIKDKQLVNALVNKFQVCIDRLNKIVYWSGNEDNK